MLDPLSANVGNNCLQFPILRHKGDYRDEHWFYVLARYKWKVHDFPHKFVNGGVLSISNSIINREINNNNNNNNNLKKKFVNEMHGCDITTDFELIAMFWWFGYIYSYFT